MSQIRPNAPLWLHTTITISGKTKTITSTTKTTIGTRKPSSFPITVTTKTMRSTYTITMTKTSITNAKSVLQN